MSLIIHQRLHSFDRALTTEELAEIWAVTPYTVRQWITRDKRYGLRAYKNGNEWKVDPADAIEFWEKRATRKAG
jgi:hypothetical protein